MRNLKLLIEYDGTNYQGWQSQITTTTIQDNIEKVLDRILGGRVRIAGSGRTDSGVHALGQVASFATNNDIPLTSLLKGANSLLPPDIVIKSIVEVDDSFHARFSAKSRTYEYRLWNARQPSVFLRNYTWWIQQRLDVGLMERTAQLLVGRHDFSSFRGSDDGDASPEREVLGVGFSREDDKIVFSIHANAFLRHMVRNIIGTLVEVGKAKISRDRFAEILEARDRRKAGVTAPPHGLFLIAVRY
jgi:tRNA pseudouridine38-40 synthase